MNGAEILVKTAAQAGIEVCFANAGTTEMPVVLALESQPGIKPILGLFEGICTGAADGYGRLLDKPAMVLLHLGPGFGNGIANLHNARRAQTPVLCIIGEHATWHLPVDPPLAMDIEALAGTVSGWYKTNRSAATLSRDVTEAIGMSARGQISTLIVPNDYLWAATTGKKTVKATPAFEPVNSDDIKKAALILVKNKTVLFIGHRALRHRGLLAAARIKAATGCDLVTSYSLPYVERGAGLPVVNRVPYFPEPAAAILAPYEAAVLAGIEEPVTFFGYPNINSYLLKDARKKVKIASPRQDPVAALEFLAEAVNAPPISKIPQGVYASPSRPRIPRGELNPEKVCLTLAALQPENAIVIDEGVTTSYGYYPLTAGLPPHAYLTNTGGSIGFGMPCAVGAAFACPDRPVINIEADGSAMYTVQALWTEARERLNVTTLICSNRSYNIIKTELNRAGFTSFGPNVAKLIDLDRPDIDWVRLSQGMGVPAVAVNTAGALAEEYRQALAEPGPHLIEMVLEPPK